MTGYPALLVDRLFFFFSSRRRHTRCYRDWSSDVCSSDLDLGLTLDRDALQLLVHLTRRDEHRQARVASKVEDLLRLAVGPEGDLPVLHRVPHRHEMRSAVGVDRRNLEVAARFEERTDLVVAHLDGVAPAGHMRTLSPRYTFRPWRRTPTRRSSSRACRASRGRSTTGRRCST